jgi:aromatic ring hydroxylase
MMKLAWEYTADSFGSRQLLFEQHNAGTLATNKARLLAAYDPSALVALAQSLAGTSPTALGEG